MVELVNEATPLQEGDRALVAREGQPAMVTLGTASEKNVEEFAPYSHTHPLSEITNSGNAAALDVGTTAGTVAAGDDSRFTDASSHIASTSNPHNVTKAQVGLGDVDNVSAASLRDRTTHTGTQPHTTITGLGTAATVDTGTGAANVPTTAQADGRYVPLSRLLTGGTGIATIGNLSSDRTISVDSTVVRTSGNQTIAGGKTFNNGNDNSVRIDASNITGNVAALDIIYDSTITGQGNNRTLFGYQGKSNYIRGDFTFFNSTLRLAHQATTVDEAVRADRVIGSGDGLSGGGDMRFDRTLSVDSTVVRTSRTLTAGDGLTGGGNLSANRTFAVDSTVVRTSGNQVIAGLKRFSGMLSSTQGPSVYNDAVFDRYVSHKNLFLYGTNTSVETGTLVIQLKGGNSLNTFYYIRLIINRNYSPPVIVELSGYATATGWTRSAMVTSDASDRGVFHARFGRDDGGSPVILLSNNAVPTDSVWGNYVNIQADTLIAGWTGGSNSANRDPANFSATITPIEVGYTIDRTNTIGGAGGSDSRMVYNSINAIGPVGGTEPAIIQRGSNANGEFVRYADGTQECWRTFTITESATNRLSADVTLPAAFVSITGMVAQLNVPVHSSSEFNGVSRNNITQWGTSAPGGSGQFTTSVVAATVFTTSGAVSAGATITNMQLTVKGRWF